ncbi:MAG: ribosome recycling factor [Bacteroidaceae bacterium]|nr:ribosome recycling factor [Bacteroidaceae bacterium]
MRKAVKTLIEEFKAKVGGYAVLLQYRYMNLCVKAEPASLLSLEVVDSEGETMGLEQAAYVLQVNDYVFEVVPKDEELLFPICKAFIQSHPEFKQDVITSKEEDRLNRQDEEEKHVLLTMPDVDKNRYDVLMNAVSTLYKECVVQIDKAKNVYVIKLTSKMEGESSKDIDEAKDTLEAEYKKHKDLVKEYRETKEKEIEEAYQRWLTKQGEKDIEQQEMNESMGEKVTKTLNFDK